MFHLILGVANLSARELSAVHLLQETASVCCCKRRQSARSKDVEKDHLFLFTQRIGVENMLFALCSEKFCGLGERLTFP